ncbi:MAG: phosphodiesterase, partial [Burkholderiales bacterium PBB5]
MALARLHRRRALLQHAASLPLGLALGGCAAVAAGPGSDAGADGLPQVPAGQALQRIAFGSCINQALQPQPIWDAVLAAQPQLFVFGGDNVYASTPPWSLAQLESAYATQAAVPGFAQLRRTVPHLAIWDDHDYGKNDAGAEWAQKQVAKDAFLRFWQVPANDPRRQHGGL